MAQGAESEDDIPHSLRIRPVLNQFQSVYWKAFQELTGSRQYTSSGVADIPYHIKIMWLNENGIIDQDERNDYLQMISILDGTYCEHCYEKLKVK